MKITRAVYHNGKVGQMLYNIAPLSNFPIAAEWALDDFFDDVRRITGCSETDESRPTRVRFRVEREEGDAFYKNDSDFFIPEHDVFYFSANNLRKVWDTIDKLFNKHLVDGLKPPAQTQIPKEETAQAKATAENNESQ